MIRRHAALFQIVLMAADALAAVAVLFVVSSVRFGSDAVRSTALDTSLPDSRIAIGVFIAMWIGLLWLRGLYHVPSKDYDLVKQQGFNIVQAGPEQIPDCERAALEIRL